MKKLTVFFLISLISACNQPTISGTTNNIINPSPSTQEKLNIERNSNLVAKIDGNSQATEVILPPHITKLDPVMPSQQLKDNKLNDSLKNTVPVESTPYPSPFATTQPTVTSSNPIDFRDKPFGYYSDPNYGRKYPYSKVDPISKNLRDGSINIIFKDEYKIRLKNYLENFCKYQQKTTELKSGEYQELYKSIPLLDEFSSLDPSVIEAKKKELSQINEILKKYNVLEIRLSTLIANGEANELQTEKEVQKIYDEGDHGYDVHNIYSHYTISVKDTDIYNLINELRNVEIVRQANYELKGTND